MYNIFDYYDKDDHLAHYGVPGMRWGVRHDPQKAYTRASKKFNRLANKSDKAYRKSQKYNYKANRRSVGSNKREAEIARRAYQKSYKNARRASKWMNKMEKAFANQSVVALDPGMVSRGENILKRYGVHTI